jgi:hypothetical protein
MRPYKADPSPSFLLFFRSSSSRPASRPPAARQNSQRPLHPAQILATRSFLSLPASLPTRPGRASDIPWPESKRPRAAARRRRPRSTSPLTTTSRPVSDQIGYGKHIPTLPRSSCTPPPSLFAGPSPGTCVRRHGRRHLSSPAMLHPLSWCTSPTPRHSRSRGSCWTGSSSPKPSPPARTRRADPPATVEESQGHICEYFSCSKGPCAKTRGPLCKLPCYFMWAKLPACKIHRNR